MSKFRILLLTNRDSDNVGDQIIEATAIALIKGAMKNLGVPEDGFSINSRAAGFITRQYLKTGDPALLADARKAIAAADVVVFGGAPLFNYTYQSFYKRTIATVQIAHEYGVPVLFSSIGVEPFNPDNPKSLELKETLALPEVRQITTRDDISSLERYVEGTDVQIAHVSDPAVFSDIVFDRSTKVPAPGSRARKRIGLVVTREGIFADNGIAFSEEDQRAMWRDVIALLEARGYDYRLFTTGHFSDEVFLDAFIRSGGAPASKAAFTVNSPEELIQELASCDGVVAYRLHASITSFAYEVPSVGLSWNFKVPFFYESVGHGDRALPPERWTAADIVSVLERAMREGVTKDVPFLMSVYETLFTGLRGIVDPRSDATPYTFDELRAELPRYAGTSHEQYRTKVQVKARRSYDNYQKLSRFRRNVERKRAEAAARAAAEKAPAAAAATAAAAGAPSGGGVPASPVTHRLVVRARRLARRARRKAKKVAAALPGRG